MIRMIDFQVRGPVGGGAGRFASPLLGNSVHTLDILYEHTHSRRWNVRKNVTFSKFPDPLACDCLRIGVQPLLQNTLRNHSRWLIFRFWWYSFDLSTHFQQCYATLNDYFVFDSIYLQYVFQSIKWKRGWGALNCFRLRAGGGGGDY